MKGCLPAVVMFAGLMVLLNLGTVFAIAGALVYVGLLIGGRHGSR